MSTSDQITPSERRELRAVVRQQMSTGVVDQMDPNGVYAPQSSQGTFVMCVDQNGQPHPAYWEGDVETEFGAARWDTGTHQVVAVGPATFHFSTKQGG